MGLETEDALLARITTNPEIFGGKPIVRGHRLAVEHVLGMLSAGDTAETVLKGTPGSRPRTSARASSMRVVSSVTNVSNHR